MARRPIKTYGLGERTTDTKFGHWKLNSAGVHVSVVIISVTTIRSKFKTRSIKTRRTGTHLANDGAKWTCIVTEVLALRFVQRTRSVVPDRLVVRRYGVRRTIPPGVVMEEDVGQNGAARGHFGQAARQPNQDLEPTPSADFCQDVLELQILFVFQPRFARHLFRFRARHLAELTSMNERNPSSGDGDDDDL